MVYVLDENDRDCLTIRIDWSKGGYSPIPKATCEMLNRGCGCNCGQSTNDNKKEATIELTCEEVKKLLALGDTKPKPEPKEEEEAIPCITEKDFDRLLDEYKYYDEYASEPIGLGSILTPIGGAQKPYYVYSSEAQEEEFKVKLKERLENFEPFKGKYFFGVIIKRAEGITELGYTKFGTSPYRALVSCHLVDNSYCFLNYSFYIGFSQGSADGSNVPIITNDDYDNKGISNTIQDRLNYDRDTTFGVVEHNATQVVSVKDISEENKQDFYTKLGDHLFNAPFMSIDKGTSTVKFTLGEPTVQVGDAYKEQEYTVPITIEVTTGNLTSTTRATVPMETREVAE